VPPVEVLAIEQQFPPGGFFRGAERIDFGIFGGGQRDGGGKNQGDG
jgi:hypothetical protein